MVKQLDLSQDGLGMFFKDWQIPLVEIINGPRFTETNPLRSRDAWLNTNKLLPEGQSISRASVIFFLQDLEDMGWLSSRKQSGRGGYHDVYWKRFPLNEFVNKKLQGLSEKAKKEGT